jgi:hypothetical protein
MTDNMARVPVKTSPGAVNDNIRAELARRGYTAHQAQGAIGLGETAWRTRMNQPRRWQLGDLLDLARLLDLDVSDLVRGVR